MNSSQRDISATNGTGSSGECSGSTTITTTKFGTSSDQGTSMIESKATSSARELRNMAEKHRRDKLNHYVSEIANIVPVGSSSGARRIDKTSVLRLAASYIRMHKVLNDENEPPFKTHKSFGQDIANNLTDAVGGFLLVVTSVGKVLYISEAVDQYFGYTQVDLLGQSFYSVIHPDDHGILQQQLKPKENCRRSFYCRMLEKGLCRNDPCRYEIVLVVGQLRPLPQVPLPCPVPSPDAPSPGEASLLSDHDDEVSLDSDGEPPSVKASRKQGTHLLVSFVRLVKDRPITELTLVESTQDEYITRHGIDGKILYTDHRISFVTGLMPSEVIGTSAFNYMYQDDILWSVVAQKLMFTSTQGQGTVSYRLICKDGAHVTLRSRGFLEVDKQTGQVESFVCINTVLSNRDADSEIKNQRRKLLPVISSSEADHHLSFISSSLPPELASLLKQVMSPETVSKMVQSLKNSKSTTMSNNSKTIKMIPMNSASTLTSKPTNQYDKSGISNECHTLPKRICKEPSYESEPQTCTPLTSLNENKCRSASVKQSYGNNQTIVASAGFSHKPDLSSIKVSNSGYLTNTSDIHFTSGTDPPLRVSSTSPVPENPMKSQSVTCQQYSGSIHISHSSDFIQPKESKQYKRKQSSENYWQPNTVPQMPDQSEQSSQCFKTDPQCIGQNTFTKKYNQKITVPSAPDASQVKDSAFFPSNTSVVTCENPSTFCHNKLTCVNFAQNRQDLMCMSGVDSQQTQSSLFCSDPKASIVTYKQSTSNFEISNLDINSPIPCQNSSSKENLNCGSMKLNPIAQGSDPSVGRNISFDISTVVSHHDDVVSPSNQSTQVLQHSNQLTSQYSQPSSSTPSPKNPSQYQYCDPSEEQSSIEPHQTLPPSTSKHRSTFLQQYQKPLNSQAKRSSKTESGSHLISITSDHFDFGGLIPGEPSVPDTFIPDLSSYVEPVSKDSLSIFQNGHFQHYSEQNHHEGKL